MLAFTLNGVLAACAGIVFASQIGFVPNQTGSGLEMKAIAACVLGGISLLGGTGTLVGAFLGAFFLTQIDTVLVLFKLRPGGMTLSPGWCCWACWCSTDVCARRWPAISGAEIQPL
jgi:ribose/xylose/arabinose/galactoside ABC-type transport system permease subunit